MYSFVVGGFVPGTNIQLSFYVVISILAGIAFVVVCLWIKFRSVIKKSAKAFIEMLLEQQTI
jgi:hypothetical protein